jgi:DNA repair exonuclease SbcCD ATPase subunit
MRTSDNPFAKVEALISDMIKKLETEAEADAVKKAWCDKEMAENAAKKEDKRTELSKLNTKIAQKTAQSAKLKEEVATLQKELATLAKEQAEMDRVRQEENAAYSKNKPEMEKGLEGISLALKVLREYYSKEEGDHDAAEGAASGIIGLLEVAESDFTKGIAEMTAQEESAAAAYEKETNENEIVRTTKQQDAKYKTKEAASLDQAVAELSADSSNVQEELDAVLQYGKELDKECVAKAETYEERVARRNAELAGLKEALEILSNDAALVQEGASRRAFRGSHLSVA